jgi:peptide/nickel transport system permease protein
MGRYLLRRLVQAVPTLLGITIISFLLMLSTPGDPIVTLTFKPTTQADAVERLRRQLGLDQPPLVQYMYWLVGNDWTTIDVDGDGTGDLQGSRRGILRADLGNSIQHKRPVIDLIMERVPATLLLTVSAVIVGYLIGILIGLLSAVYHDSLFDQITRVFSVIGNALPAFWLGLLLIIIFGVNLNWLPISGMRDITRANRGFNFFETLPYMIMPVSVLALGIISFISRYTRSQVLEVIAQDYVRTASAKGLRQRTIRLWHIARNALIPIATLLGASLGGLLGGAVVIEQVFAWPGLGSLVLSAVSQRDYPLIMGSVVFSAALYIVALLLSDTLYVLVDPRIRFE